MTAVLFDFSGTLFRVESTESWLRAVLAEARQTTRVRPNVPRMIWREIRKDTGAGRPEERPLESSPR